MLDQAHQSEHSLEVHLPFLQVTLNEFSLVPFAIGQADAEQVAEVIRLFWDDPQTLVVISSDLSHFHDYETARVIDAETAQLIEQGIWQQLHGKRACGYCGIQGLLKLIGGTSLGVRAVDIRNSGDTSGDKNQGVVGYGCFVVT